MYLPVSTWKYSVCRIRDTCFSSLLYVQCKRWLVLNLTFWHRLHRVIFVRCPMRRSTAGQLRTASDRLEKTSRDSVVCVTCRSWQLPDWDFSISWELSTGKNLCKCISKDRSKSFNLHVNRFAMYDISWFFKMNLFVLFSLWTGHRNKSPVGVKIGRMLDCCILPDLKLPLPWLHCGGEAERRETVLRSQCPTGLAGLKSQGRLVRRHRFSCLLWDEYQIVTVCYSQKWSKGCQCADGPCKDWSSQTDLWSCSPVSEIQCRIETLDEAGGWFCFMISLFWLFLDAFNSAFVWECWMLKRL